MYSLTEVVTPSRAVRWYVFARLLLLLVIGLPGLLTLLLSEGISDQVKHDSLLLGVALASNLVFYLLARKDHSERYFRLLAVAWILVDIFLISSFIFINGGIESRSPILYAVPILISAAIFGHRAAYTAAAASTLAYTSLILADYLNVVQSLGALDPTLRSDGSYVFSTVIFFPAIFIVIAIAVNFITKLLTEKQREIEKHLRALSYAQEIAHIGSWKWNIETDTIIWSDELIRIFKLPKHPKSIAYGAYMDMIHPDDAKDFDSVITKCVRDRQPFVIDHRIVLHDGSIRHIHSEGKPILDDNGKVTKLVGIARDITEQHRLDIAKNEFVSLASHQLRTPASGVKAYLSILVDDRAGELSPQQSEFVKKAYDANDRQLAIIDTLLNLASIQSGKIKIKKELVDLRHLIDLSLPNHQVRAEEKNHKLKFNKPRRPILVNADSNLFQMVIDNLISNAIKYTPDGGRVSINLRANDTSVYMEIEDSGIGIDKKDLPALFKRFSRIDNESSRDISGSGLGLYLARHIVNLHGGSITVQSEPGVGSKFRARLPLSIRKG